MRLKAGDLAVQDCIMPYPNTVYRVEEVDQYGNFRGTPVFRLASNGPWKKDTTWMGPHAFRKLEAADVILFRKMLDSILPNGGT